MKTTRLYRNTKIAIATGALIMTASAHASDYHPSKATEAKQAGTAITSMAVGAAAGGPAGLVAGMLVGHFFVDQIGKADRAEHSELALAEAETELATLRRELLAAHERETQAHELALQSLDLQVLFHTGKDELSTRGRERVAKLAEFLRENPNLKVRLDGHADPRGSEGYNQILSEYRARNVEAELLTQGIDKTRIERYAHGASQSQAARGDLQAYALERRVGVEVFNPDRTAQLSAAR